MNDDKNGQSLPDDKISTETVDLAKTLEAWDSKLLSAQYLYIKAFEDLTSAKRKLEQKETERKSFECEMKEKWDALSVKQQEFKEEATKYDQFYLENKNKQKRISDRIARQINIQDSCKEKITMAENRISKLDQVLERMMISCDRMKPFHDFLSNMKSPDDGEDGDLFVENLIHQYKLLNSQTILHNESIHLQKEVVDVQRCTQEQLNMISSYENIYEMLKPYKVSKLSKPIDQLDESYKTTFMMEAITEIENIISDANKLQDKSNLSCDVCASGISKKRAL